jgi:hypothetical protein
MGLGEQDSLEHGWMGSGIDDDMVAGAEERAERLADRLGARGEGDGSGKPEKSGEAVLQRQDRRAQAIAWGDKAVGAKRGQGGGADSGMGGQGKIILQGEVQPRAGLGRRNGAGFGIEKPEERIVQSQRGVEGGPGHGGTFLVWPATADDRTGGGLDAH